MSFFDEGDEPTRVRSRAARPRRPATAARSAAGGPPDRQTARLRQAVGLGALVVLAFVIVLGFKGCLDSRKDNALKDYNRNVTAVINDSDQSVGKPFFQRMANGARNSQELQVQVNQLRLAAEDDVKRAKAFDVPGDMTAAQRNLELVLNLRAEALTKIADQIPAALGRGQTSEDAIARIAGEMQLPLSSDVVYAERVAPLIKDALDKNDVKGQQIAGSRFMNDISWLSPATVASGLGRSAGGSSTTGTSGTPAPGLHGHGLDATSIGATTLQPEAPGVVNRVPWSNNPTHHHQVHQPGRQQRVQREGLDLGQADLGQGDRDHEDHLPDDVQAALDGEHPARRGAAGGHAHHAQRPDRQGPGREDDEQQPLQLHGHLHALSAVGPGLPRIHRRRAYPWRPWTSSPRQRGSSRWPRAAWR